MKGEKEGGNKERKKDESRGKEESKEAEGELTAVLNMIRKMGEESNRKFDEMRKEMKERRRRLEARQLVKKWKRYGGKWVK